MSSDDQLVTVLVRSLEGSAAASWTGSPRDTVAHIRSAVSRQLGRHRTLITLLWGGRELADDDVLADLRLPEKAEVQCVVSNVLAERKWEELQEKLQALDYGSATAGIFPLAVECLDIGMRAVNEVAGTVRDGVEDAGSLTEMPDDWFEVLANHPDSKCDTPAQWHNDLIHAAIFHGISLADKPFFRNGPWADKVDYPEWGWSSRIGGTPLDMAARKLEISLESPPNWGLRSELPRPDDELDRLQANFMTLLRSGFKMSRVEGGRRAINPLHYDSETVWKLTLLDRAEAPYGRYAAIHSAWKDAGMPLVAIPACNTRDDNDA